MVQMDEFDRARTCKKAMEFISNKSQARNQIKLSVTPSSIYILFYGSAAEWANFLSREINQSGCNSPEKPKMEPVSQVVFVRH
jgi:fatty acid-binding protein DegV